MNNGLLLLGGAIALWLLSKAHTGQNLQFLPLGANWDGGALQITIGVQNPTNDSLQLSSLVGQVYVNGTSAGNVSSFIPTAIIPNAQTPVQLTFTPNYLSAIPALLNQFLGGGSGAGGLTIAVKGTANVNSILLPIDLTFQPIAA